MRFALVPRVKSHPPLKPSFTQTVFYDPFVKLFKSLAPGRAAGGTSCTGHFPQFPTPGTRAFFHPFSFQALIEVNLVQGEPGGGCNLPQGPRIVSCQGFTDIIQADLSPAQPEQLSHDQSNLVAHKPAGVDVECVAGFGEEAGRDLGVLLNPAQEHLPFKNGPWFGLGAVLYEVVGSLEQKGPFPHFVDVQVLLEGAEQRGAERVAFLPEGKEGRCTLWSSGR